MRVPDMSSGTRSPVAASSSSTCAAASTEGFRWDPNRKRLQMMRRPASGSCLCALPPGRRACGGGRAVQCRPLYLELIMRMRCVGPHLDLALALGEQLVADPVLVREVAGAPLVGILLAEHAVALVAPMVPASQRRGCQLRQKRVCTGRQHAGPVTHGGLSALQIHCF